MNTASKLYIIILTQLSMTIIQSFQLLLVFTDIIPHNEVQIFITILTIMLTIIVTGYSFDIESEYYQILNDLKHWGEEEQ